MVTSGKNLPFFSSQDPFVHGLLQPFPMQVTESHARSNSGFPPETNDCDIIELISTAHLLVEDSLLSMIIRNKGSREPKARGNRITPTSSCWTHIILVPQLRSTGVRYP